MHQCPSCKGHKAFTPVVARRVNSTPPEARQPFTITCDLCHGKGEVDDKTLERYNAGQVMKEDRLRRGRGLREDAELRGIKPSLLSALENGRIPREPACRR